MSIELKPGKDPNQGKLLFDRSVPGHGRDYLPHLDVPKYPFPARHQPRQNLRLPVDAEVEVVRYFTYLSTLNHGVESGAYPLGSCTMKYNPKDGEVVAALPGFALTHPDQAEETVQGNLQLMYELQNDLAKITGMKAVALSPLAGSQGELTGIKIVKAYQESKGEGSRRRKILVPDSAHGTNPATAFMEDYETVEIPSDSEGNVDMNYLSTYLEENGDQVAAMMLTIPSTLGFFEPNILSIAEKLHAKGALLYGDGANMNALIGKVRPGDLGFDIMHLNLHKTFSAPHGGGGPGAGPVCVTTELVDFLPYPVIERKSNEDNGPEYRFAKPAKSIGSMGGWHGNFGVLVRAYAYIRTLGSEGLREVAEGAVLNANYLLAGLKDVFSLQYGQGRNCMHEIVLQPTPNQLKNGIHAGDIANRMIDFGIHPPTIYFPLIVKEALMFEPTETESPESLDFLIKVMEQIAREARTKRGRKKILEAPHVTPISHPDMPRAMRSKTLYLRWRPEEPSDISPAA